MRSVVPNQAMVAVPSCERWGRCSPGVTAWKSVIAAAEKYAQTIAAIGYAFQRETDAVGRYVDFAGVAGQEGYKGIAYMFTAFAASEGVHARDFKGLITQLGGQANPAPTTIKRGTTKQNLIAAVDDEIDSIDGLYPRTLERTSSRREIARRRGWSSSPGSLSGSTAT